MRHGSQLAVGKVSLGPLQGMRAALFFWMHPESAISRIGMIGRLNKLQNLLLFRAVFITVLNSNKRIRGFDHDKFYSSSGLRKSTVYSTLAPSLDFELYVCLSRVLMSAQGLSNPDRLRFIRAVAYVDYRVY